MTSFCYRYFSITSYVFFYSVICTLFICSYYLLQVFVITLSLCIHIIVITLSTCSYYLLQVFVITLSMCFMISISLLYSCIRSSLRPIKRPVSVQINRVIYNYIHLELDTFTIDFIRFDFILFINIYANIR
jgi:hypothetical protein